MRGFRGRWLGAQADMHDVQLATVATFRHILEADELLQGLERRQALKDWVDLLAVSHPLDRYASKQPWQVMLLSMSCLHHLQLRACRSGLAHAHARACWGA